MSGASGSRLQGLQGLRLVDFGSGDGRIVAAAASKGMVATGYELNPCRREKRAPLVSGLSC